MLYKYICHGEGFAQQVLYSIFCLVLSFIYDSNLSGSRARCSSRRDHPIRGRWQL